MRHFDFPPLSESQKTWRTPTLSPVSKAPKWNKAHRFKKAADNPFVLSVAGGLLLTSLALRANNDDDDDEYFAHIHTIVVDRMDGGYSHRAIDRFSYTFAKRNSTHRSPSRGDDFGGAMKGGSSVDLRPTTDEDRRHQIVKRSN
uniref:Inhibitor_I29 domain-containing protein n=1 Tax=Panagrellus redivivus TaxID=6233 RepID=A0A7E4VPA3_PANRE